MPNDDVMFMRACAVSCFVTFDCLVREGQSVFLEWRWVGRVGIATGSAANSWNDYLAAQ